MQRLLAVEGDQGVQPRRLQPGVDDVHHVRIVVDDEHRAALGNGAGPVHDDGGPLDVCGREGGLGLGEHRLDEAIDREASRRHARAGLLEAGGTGGVEHAADAAGRHAGRRTRHQDGELRLAVAPEQILSAQIVAEDGRQIRHRSRRHADEPDRSRPLPQHLARRRDERIGRHQPAARPGRRPPIPCGPRHHPAHPQQHLHGLDGLDEVIVGPEREAGHAIGRRRVRGHEHDRDVRQRGIGLDAPADVVSVQFTAQLHVEEDQRRPVCGGLRYGAQAVGGQRDTVGRTLQILDHARRLRRIAGHQQHVRADGRSRRRGPRWRLAGQVRGKGLLHDAERPPDAGRVVRGARRVELAVELHRPRTHRR